MRTTKLRARLAGLTGRRRVLAAAAGVAFVAGLATGASQYAGASPQPTLAQVEAKVNQYQAEYDQAVQQYDAASSQLTTAQSRLAQVNKELATDKSQYQSARRQVVQIAAASYEDSGQTSLAGLLTSDDPSAVLGAASLLTQIAGARNAQTQAFLADAQQLVSVQQTQQHTEYGIQQLTTQRASTKKYFLGLLTQQKSLLSTLTAQQRQAVSDDSPGGGSSAPVATPVSAKASNAQAQTAINYVLDAVNKCWYQWGGTGPCSAGYDCSGLMMAAWAAAGVSIPRDTYEQWSALPHISLSDLQPGDMIYYSGESHVAMYVGDGMIVDAPESGKMVEEIPESTSWYADNADGAVRV